MMWPPETGAFVLGGAWSWGVAGYEKTRMTMYFRYLVDAKRVK